MSLKNLDLDKHLRLNKLPHIWCPGCGHGIVTGALIRALEKLGKDNKDIVIVSGIGCSSRASTYLNYNTLHTTHGRALAFATGVKMANPELEVIVLMGDGDCTAIGGNHFIHAARRNINLTAVIFNNNIYGMTGGQFSPMTSTDGKATTSPLGSIDHPFDLVELAKGAGASFVARSTSYHSQMLSRYIYEGIVHKGFAAIEAVTHCPTYYGRKNKLGSPANMLKLQKELVSSGKLLTGKFASADKPEYTEEYNRLREKYNREDD